MLQHIAQSFPETRVWDFFPFDDPCIGACTNFGPHRHWAKTKCSYDFASDVTKDANGNTVEKDVDGTVTSYTYDDQNRLLSANLNGSLVSFEYDADGARVSKTVDGVTTEYLLDKNQRYHQVLEERTDSGSLIAEYVYGNQRISMKRGGKDRFYHYDGHGSTSELTDGAGLVTDEYSYEAFGNLIASTGIGINPFLYTGEAWDSETGLEYLRARYYMPRTGRFLNMDTHPGNNQAPLTLNKYLYGNANPVMFADPSGMFSLLEIQVSLNTAAILSTVALSTIGDTEFFAGSNYRGSAGGLSRKWAIQVYRNTSIDTPGFEAGRVGFEGILRNEKTGTSREIWYEGVGYGLGDPLPLEIAWAPLASFEPFETHWPVDFYFFDGADASVFVEWQATILGGFSKSYMNLTGVTKPISLDSFETGIGISLGGGYEGNLYVQNP